jgi:hypothetical protein
VHEDGVTPRERWPRIPASRTGSPVALELLRDRPLPVPRLVASDPTGEEFLARAVARV